MLKQSFLLSVILAAALVLAACAGGNNNNDEFFATMEPGMDETQEIPNTGATDESLMLTPTLVVTTEPLATNTAAATSTPAATNTPAAPLQTPEATRQAGGSVPVTGVIGLPRDDSRWYVGLAELYNFRVVDMDGNEIGAVQDFVINMCEAHILYIVVEPDAALGVAGEGQLLIPYEALLETPNSGRVSVDEGVFVIDAAEVDFAAAPLVQVETVEYESGDWDTEVMAYWSGYYTLALTTGCSVPVNGPDNTGLQSTQAPGLTATPEVGVTTTPQAEITPTQSTTGDRQEIYRVALASRLFGAAFEDGNGQLLGSVRDLAIVPETGAVHFVVVELNGENNTASGLVALPPGAVNIRYEAGSDQPVIVLLVEARIMLNAPMYDAANGHNDDAWFTYWDQYIPMTLDQLP